MTTAAKTPRRNNISKRGWHPLTREAVSASQRKRLLDAMAEAVAQNGYASTSVADVITLAGVSRRTFYEQFQDKEDCFLAAYRAGMELLLDGISGALTPLPKNDWRRRTQASLAAYLEVLSSHPAAAWTYSIEVLGAGHKALKFRGEILERWVTQWHILHQIARSEDPGIPAAESPHLLALVGGIEELVRGCLLQRGAEHLPELADTATRLALTTLMGAHSE